MNKKSQKDHHMRLGRFVWAGTYEKAKVLALKSYRTRALCDNCGAIVVLFFSICPVCDCLLTFKIDKVKIGV